MRQNLDLPRAPDQKVTHRWLIRATRALALRKPRFGGSWSLFAPRKLRASLAARLARAHSVPPHFPPAPALASPPPGWPARTELGDGTGFRAHVMSSPEYAAAKRCSRVPNPASRQFSGYLFPRCVCARGERLHTQSLLRACQALLGSLIAANPRGSSHVSGDRTIPAPRPRSARDAPWS